MSLAPFTIGTTVPRPNQRWTSALFGPYGDLSPIGRRFFAACPPAAPLPQPLHHAEQPTTVSYGRRPHAQHQQQHPSSSSSLRKLKLSPPHRTSSGSPQPQPVLRHRRRRRRRLKGVADEATVAAASGEGGGGGHEGGRGGRGQRPRSGGPAAWSSSSGGGGLPADGGSSASSAPPPSDAAAPMATVLVRSSALNLQSAPPVAWARLLRHQLKGRAAVELLVDTTFCAGAWLC